MKMKALIVAAALSLLSPLSAQAALIVGQIDVNGTFSPGTSDFSATGNVDVINPGIVLLASGDFGLTLTPFVTLANLSDIDFNAPGTIWQVGGFTFTATSFANITAPPVIPGPGFYEFTADGIISSAGFDDTPFLLLWSGQAGGQSTVSFSSSASNVVPEPASLALLGVGLLALGLGRRKLKISS